MKDLFRKKRSSPIIIDDIIVSSELATEQFLCDLKKCKGACCVEGDIGAPLANEELEILGEIYPIVETYMNEKGRQAVKEEGLYVKDFTGEWTTPLVQGKECAYTIFEEDGTAKCAIEKAHLDGKIDFKKPISCHLYPIRVSGMRGGMKVLNYDRWSICSDACALGVATKLAVYKFLKEPIERAFGEEFYGVLEQAVEMQEKEEEQK